MASLGVRAETTPQPGPSGFSTHPVANEGQRWRLGYYEGGSHGNYYEYLAAVVNGLMELGWIEMKALPRDRDKSTRALWSWLASNASSEFVEFVEDGYYSANWSQVTRERLRGELIGRLKQRQDLDLVFALGTWAGRDLANDEHSTPTMVMSASDPVGSGIIESIHESVSLRRRAGRCGRALPGDRRTALTGSDPGPA